LPCLAEPRTVAWGRYSCVSWIWSTARDPVPARVSSRGWRVLFLCVPGAAAWRDRRMTAYDQLGGSSGAAAVSVVRVRRWADCP
jgi:hypothetical protein